ncbi:phosphatase PAP2 family protein [Paenibacillus sp. HJGM_3]|uniref:phosphatase PAP2 family protein n=1 Tax=Paenibacillus sp. HJGM_3 TaxID=3379816 RepID=UPI00385E0A1B
MFLIHSMTQVAILIAVSVYILLFFSMNRNPLQPFHAAGVFVHEIFTSRKVLFHFAAVLLVLFFNKIEQSVERNMDYHADFTPSVFKLEGQFVSMFQKLFENSFLTHVLSYYYVVVFTALMVGSMFLYLLHKNKKLFYALCYAIILNYMIAIPFYLFFPVTEVHAFNPNVRFLMLDVFPSFETEYRPLSGLDNCFPSLHTSLSVTLAILARRSGNLFWKRFVPISAVIIIFSIFYLGIHWLTDMTGGLVLGLFASKLALRLSEGRQLAPVSLKERFEWDKRDAQ